MTTKLPKEALEIIDQYLRLPLAGHLIQCPYFKNQEGIRGSLRVYGGKGSPQEIKEEVELLAQRDKIDLAELTPDNIREFMTTHGIGVDCSGLVSNVFFVINPAILKEVSAKSFWKNPLRFLIARLRVRENISVLKLTDAAHARKLESIHETRPGDLIRTRGGSHVLLVTETLVQGNLIKEIKYIHSTLYYDAYSGVKEGMIKVIYPNETLDNQEWSEVDEREGRNFTLEGYLEDLQDSGIYRVNNLNIAHGN